MREVTLEGLNCAHCAKKMEDELSRLNSINKVELNFVTKKLKFELNPDINYQETLGSIERIISSIDSSVKIYDCMQPKSLEFNLGLFKLIISITAYIVALSGIVDSWFYTLIYLFVGYDVICKAIRNLIKGKIFDENFLMTVATLGAILINEPVEAVGVMLFYKVGEYLQQKSLDKSRASIEQLMDIQVDTANLVVDSKITQTKCELIKVDDTIAVFNGDKIPLDGVIINGSSNLDMSALTGESMPVDVGVGDKVLSGSINYGNIIYIKVEKTYENSTVAKILELIDQASSKKSKTENFITKFSRYYTPAVTIIAFILAFTLPFFSPMTFSQSIYRGLIFLVVSCPCALLLSIPLGFYCGIGYASKQGILVKGSNYLEVLKDVNTVVFDKTGTLTKGEFEVTEIYSVGVSKYQLLEYAAIAQVNSNHPIAKSILSKYNNEIDLTKIQDYQEICGQGIKVLYNNEEIIVGNRKLMHEQGIKIDVCLKIGTVIYVAVNNMFIGHIIIADSIKDDAISGIKKLKQVGVKHIVMLTGDNARVAKVVAVQLGLFGDNNFYAGLLPHDKVQKIEEILATSSGKVAFVGDGVNDAPVLARADVGIAMGGIGTDAAIAAADIVVMNDEIEKIATMISISKRTNQIIYQNIILALSIKLIVLTLGLGGMCGMWEAIFADVGVAIIAVLNASRILNMPLKFGKGNL
ncbi:MAG: cadmium-translocating P-type ATPase [Epulopiscium sp. Nuni2H_MBin001]|nr:MAG: cadmium-translocating P-type ATPase [Epulopiscium sp. Nuni2H_MBin001]